jgi:hypothetical protein
MRLGSGVVVVIGALLYIYAILGPAKTQIPRHIEKHKSVAEGQMI